MADGWRVGRTVTVIRRRKRLSRLRWRLAKWLLGYV
jgi:hypothetical protein